VTRTFLPASKTQNSKSFIWGYSLDWLSYYVIRFLVIAGNDQVSKASNIAWNQISWENWWDIHFFKNVSHHIFKILAANSLFWKNIMQSKLAVFLCHCSFSVCVCGTIVFWGERWEMMSLCSPCWPGIWEILLPLPPEC
jgi:hypothetical protein